MKLHKPLHLLLRELQWQLLVAIDCNTSCLACLLITNQNTKYRLFLNTSFNFYVPAVLACPFWVTLESLPTAKVRIYDDPQRGIACFEHTHCPRQGPGSTCWWIHPFPHRLQHLLHVRIRPRRQSNSCSETLQLWRGGGVDSATGFRSHGGWQPLGLFSTNPFPLIKVL